MNLYLVFCSLIFLRICFQETLPSSDSVLRHIFCRFDSSLAANPHPPSLLIYKLWRHLDTSFCLRLHLYLSCFCNLKSQCLQFYRCFNPTRFWSKSGPLWFKKAYVFLALSTCFFEPERSTFRSDQFWPKVLNISLFCLNLSVLSNSRARSITSL